LPSFTVAIGAVFLFASSAFILGITLQPAKTHAATTCEPSITKFLKSEKKAFETTFHKAYLISSSDAVELVENNNTDLSESDIAGIKAIEHLPGMEFYYIDHRSPAGDVGELLVAIKADCSVLERLPVFTE
jgi:hypothetical protein